MTGVKSIVMREPQAEMQQSAHRRRVTVKQPSYLMEEIFSRKRQDLDFQSTSSILRKMKMITGKLASPGDMSS